MHDARNFLRDGGGKTKEIPRPQNLKMFVEQFCRTENRVIAELNGQIIKDHQWPNTVINDGDKIELVHFVGGG